MKNKVYVGMSSPDGKSGWRIDWDPKDPEKGLHVNWWRNFDQSMKRSEMGPETKRGYFTVPGAGLQEYRDIIRHFPHN
ncbi:hypothetical protein ACFUIT_34630 [Streptomyces sp. NPDC057239]|uniref:hypothetical protein n=1 Tax=Streptomyces sp. NPDC057239 TaxID=3346061 RepID=UPI00362F08A6